MAANAGHSDCAEACISPVQIAVRATAASVDQPRFGRQIGLVDQRLHRQIGQALGRGRRLSCNECAHHQLLNLAGGL